MIDFVFIPWHVEDQPYTVKVEMPTYSTGSVAAIYAESGTRIPTLDWEAHGFDQFQLDLCVMRALNAVDTHECKGDHCPC